MRHTDIINKMTIEEKAAFLSGASEWESREISRLNIPAVFFSDGPHGIRKQEGAGDHLGLNASVPATCFPPAATVCNSWNEKLGEEVGEALGEEAAALGVDVLLGPGLNIKRSPLCGRNFEYFSEDPYLAGKMAAAYIRGIQSKGVYACPKHFAVNSQELRRMAMNSVIDERTLREIYLEGFEIAVKEGGAKAIMTSYNEINGVYANENGHLLKEILREEWEFDGIVVTDWGASNDHVKGVACRSNLEMPDPGLEPARELLEAVENGGLTTEELDACVDDLLEAVLTLEENRKAHCSNDFDAEAHHALAKKAALESIVLLKNENKPLPLLPLKENCRVALIGDFALVPRYQGAGSSMVNPTQLETMENMIGKYPVNCLGCEPGYRRNGEPDEALKNAAVRLAQTADVVLYCFGLDELSESEGMDREHMRIPKKQIELLEALAEANPNIVGVLSAGSAVEMPWHNYCRSIVHGYLGGQAGAGAMLDVLTGKVNPSGRLNETYPLKYEDTPAFRYCPGRERNSEYRESIFVGYRYYDTKGAEVQYPFGYGLSYTEFSYSDLKLSSTGTEFTVSNIGDRDGAEVVQMYISGPKKDIFRPEKELKGFRKIFLKKGESMQVRIPFDERTFRYWNVKTEAWEKEGGDYVVCIGANAMDILLSENIRIEGSTQENPYDTGKMKSYYKGEIQDVPDSEFEELLGHGIPDGSWSGELGRNDAICQLYYSKSVLARLIYRILTSIKKKSEAKGKPDLNILFIYNMPFRGIAKMTHGAVNMYMADGMVEAANGHLFRGLRMIIGGFFRNKRQNREYEKEISG
ncbi:beta-glucosidase family protein [Novisyntrophococcus fermenticellae]|uniref:beta-glucosidase family protein n=1 Tax=Novisyntrophococcus fermenticellae TaxID=2068655 RepID=UPI001E5F6D85|nr:glycoside hydrolase family 3 C-terminal domain-containing protein [Novisyntrophococcus fermenticellae]